MALRRAGPQAELVSVQRADHLPVADHAVGERPSEMRAPRIGRVDDAAAHAKDRDVESFDAQRTAFADGDAIERAEIELAPAPGRLCRHSFTSSLEVCKIASTRDATIDTTHEAIAIRPAIQRTLRTCVSVGCDRGAGSQRTFLLGRPPRDRRICRASRRAPISGDARSRRALGDRDVFVGCEKSDSTNMCVRAAISRQRAIVEKPLRKRANIAQTTAA